MLLFIRVPRLKETRWSFLLPFLTWRHCDSTIRFQDTDEGKITKAKYFRWLFLFFHHIFSLSTWCKWPGNKCEKGPMGFLGLLKMNVFLKNECDHFFLFILYLEQILVHLEIIISLFYWEDIYLTDFRSTLAFSDCLNCLFNAVEMEWPECENTWTFYLQCSYHVLALCYSVLTANSDPERWPSC